MRFTILRVQVFVARFAAATWRLLATSEHVRLF